MFPSARGHLSYHNEYLWLIEWAHDSSCETTEIEEGFSELKVIF
jgi:hypothetical protein